MRPPTRVVGALVCAAALAVAREPVAAQRAPDLWVAASGAALRARTDLSSALSHATSGLELAVEGGVRWRRAVLQIGYAETALPAAPSGLPRTTRVDGFALVGARLGQEGGPVAAELTAGPHVWARIADSEIERWVVWRVGGQLHAPLVPRRVAAFAGFWAAVHGSVSGAASFAGGRGGQTGLEFRVSPDAPFAVRLAYGIEEIRTDPGPRRERVERLAFGVTLLR